MKLKNIVSTVVYLWILVMIVGLSMIFATFLVGMIYKPLLGTTLQGNVIGTIQCTLFIVMTFLFTWLLSIGLNKLLDKVLQH